MNKSFQQLQEQLKFDELMKFLDDRFQYFPEHSAANSRYSLSSFLKVAFALFSLKSASLLDFKKQTVPEQSNLRSIYRMADEIGSHHSGLAAVLVHPEEREVFPFNSSWHNSKLRIAGKLWTASDKKIYSFELAEDSVKSS